MRSARDHAPTPAAKRRMSRILTVLASSLDSAKVELIHRSPLDLLVATILSAQCTDERVNQVTPALFSTYRSARDYAQAVPGELEALKQEFQKMIQEILP